MNFATLLLVSSVLGTAPFVKGPYLQRLSTTGVEVRVELTGNAPASLEVEGPKETKTTLTDAATADFHTFHVSGLLPKTPYTYRVVSNGSVSDVGQFVTAPPDRDTDPFTFVLYGDNRTDGPSHAAVVQAIQKEPLDFLLHTGDFVQVGGRVPLWKDFFDIEHTLLRDHCVFAAVGNHELFEDTQAAEFERYFGPSDDTGSTKLYGSFRWGNTRFFLLNAFQDWSKGDERSWLERALAKADSEDALRWRIAVIHHSPWSAGPHGNNIPLLVGGIVDLLVAHHVDLVLAGHDHIYERGEASGLKYVISGGGGAPLYKDLSPKPSTEKVESTYNFVSFGVTPDLVTMLAKRPNGSTIEQCAFGHGELWGCDKRSPLDARAAGPSAPEIPTERDAPAAVTSRCGCRVLGSPDDDRSACPWLSVALSALILRKRGRGTAHSPSPSVSP